VPVITVAQRDSSGVCEIKINSSYPDVNLRLLAFTVLLSIADVAADYNYRTYCTEVLEFVSLNCVRLRR
jgi:hypothetical protein